MSHDQKIATLESMSLHFTMMTTRGGRGHLQVKLCYFPVLEKHKENFQTQGNHRESPCERFKDVSYFYFI